MQTRKDPKIESGYEVMTRLESLKQYCLPVFYKEVVNAKKKITQRGAN